MAYNLDCDSWGKGCNSTNRTEEECEECNFHHVIECQNNGNCKECGYCD